MAGPEQPIVKWLLPSAARGKNDCRGPAATDRHVLAYSVLACSQICDSDFRFGWRTFRWNHAVLYPLEAKSLLLTTWKINNKREREI
nr:MAG TPA: hypothetical protein [Caudoviricetes sp.]